MLANIIHERMTRKQARAALRAAGWKFVGGGSFAAVYGSPDGSTVAKVTKPDRGAEATRRLAREIGGPYFPRYYDAIPLINGGFVYEVERLEPFNGWCEYEDAMEAARDDPEGAAAISALADAGAADHHWTNAMQREDGTIVFTDMIADFAALEGAAASCVDAAEDDFSGKAGGRNGSDHWTENPDLSQWQAEFNVRAGW